MLKKDQEEEDEIEWVPEWTDTNLVKVQKLEAEAAARVNFFREVPDVLGFLSKTQNST